MPSTLLVSLRPLVNTSGAVRRVTMRDGLERRQARSLRSHNFPLSGVFLSPGSVAEEHGGEGEEDAVQ